MRTFHGFGALGTFMWQAAKKVDPAIQAELKVQGVAIVHATKAVFGTYQPGWAALKDSTQAARVRKGYNPDDPLFASGALQAEVKPYITHGNLFVGMMPGRTIHGIDAAKLMAIHELGTVNRSIQARPVFGIIKGKIHPQIHAFTLGVAVRVLT